MCDDDLARLITAFLEGDPEAGNQLCRIIEPPVRKKVSAFFSSDNMDVNDIVQDTVEKVLSYIKAKRIFTGKLESFAVVVADNKCKNVYFKRVRNPSVPFEEANSGLLLDCDDVSPADILESKETKELVQVALNKLGLICRKIIRGFYLEEKSVKEIRRETKFKTVQGVYYKRRICLKEISQYIMKSKVT